MSNNAAIMGNSVPLSVEGLPAGASWRQAPAMHAVPGFTQSFGRMPPNTIQPNRGVRSTTQPSAPNSVYAVDGQDWYLKDSVNWQSSFDTWNIPNASSSSAAAAGVAGGNSSGGGGGGGGGGGNGMSDPSSVFMFTSNPTNDTGQSPQTATDNGFNFDGFDDFSGSIGSWDLTGLD